MFTLVMDTSMQYLVLGILDDHQVLAKLQRKVPKRQSEEIFVGLNTVLSEAKIDVDEIQQVVVTKGPGSYTGVRIALTIAKVFASLKKIPLYTLSSLQLLAGNESGTVILDARSKRVYTASFENGKQITKASIKMIDELNLKEHLIGDLHLIGNQDIDVDLVEHFYELKNYWHLEEDIDHVKPDYLKANDAYLVR